MTTKLSKLDLHLRSRRHSLYFCVFGKKEKSQCPSTLHGHYITKVHAASISLAFLSFHTTAYLPKRESKDHRNE